MQNRLVMAGLVNPIAHRRPGSGPKDKSLGRRLVALSKEALGGGLGLNRQAVAVDDHDRHGLRRRPPVPVEQQQRKHCTRP